MGQTGANLDINGGVLALFKLDGTATLEMLYECVFWAQWRLCQQAVHLGIGRTTSLHSEAEEERETLKGFFPLWQKMFNFHIKNRAVFFYSPARILNFSNIVSAQAIFFQTSEIFSALVTSFLFIL